MGELRRPQPTTSRSLQMSALSIPSTTDRTIFWRSNNILKFCRLVNPHGAPIWHNRIKMTKYAEKNCILGTSILQSSQGTLRWMVRVCHLILFFMNIPKNVAYDWDSEAFLHGWRLNVLDIVSCYIYVYRYNIVLIRLWRKFSISA